MDENTIPEPSLEESIKFLLSQVPAPVRDFVLNNLGPKTEELMQRYQLHVDQGGILERELLLMLLGQEEPAEFVSTLQATGLSSQTVQSLTNDINKEVFMKLRGIEEKSPGNILPVFAPAAPTAQPVLPSTPVAPPISYAPPAPAPQVFVPPPPAPTPVFASTPAEPDVRTMASDIALVKSGAFEERQEAAHINAPYISPAPRPVQAPPPAPQPAMSAPVAPSVPSAPQIRPQSPPQVIAPAPKAPATPSENREALHQILKEYGVDPYREPAE